MKVLVTPFDYRVERKWMYGKDLVEYHKNKGPIQTDTYATNKKIIDFIVSAIVKRQDKITSEKYGYKFESGCYKDLGEIEKKLLWLVDNHFELMVADKDDKPKQRDRINSTVLSWDTRRDYLLLVLRR